MLFAFYPYCFNFIYILHLTCGWYFYTFCQTQDLLCWLYCIMIGCQSKYWFLYLHWWYLLPLPILRSSMLCHNLLKRQVILLPVWILQLFWFSLNSRIQHMNCCFYQIKRLCALLDCCHLVSYYNLDLQTSFLGNMIEFGIDVANLATLLVAFIWATVADLNLILISHIWKLFSGLDIPAS